jgi:hypothetical protein
LISYSLPVPGPFGLWIATESTDYILYQAETPRMHQDHIILHEVGHILAGHQDEETNDEYWQVMMPDISPEVIRRRLGRTYYDTTKEREAELVATIIMDIMGWDSVIDHVTPQRCDNPTLQRIQTTLSNGRNGVDAAAGAGQCCRMNTTRFMACPPAPAGKDGAASKVERHDL